MFVLLSFVFACIVTLGALVDRSVEDITDQISRNGGSVTESIGSSHIALSCLDMVSVHTNPYKQQFFPKLVQQVEDAQVNK